MSSLQTENSFFREKVHLRLNLLPDREEVKVLDLFSADGSLWEEVKKQTSKKIHTLRIDRLPGKKGIYLQGDNLKFMASIDLSGFDVIDLDAFGVPTPQLGILFRRKYHGRVFVTFIHTFFGRLPTQMLVDLGYTRAMQAKTQVLFNKDHMRKIEAWLALKGKVTRIQGINIANKHYFSFEI